MNAEDNEKGISELLGNFGAQRKRHVTGEISHYVEDLLITTSAKSIAAASRRGFAAETYDVVCVCICARRLV